MFGGAGFPFFHSTTLAPIFHVGYATNKDSLIVDRYQSHFSIYYSSMKSYEDLVMVAKEWNGKTKN